MKFRILDYPEESLRSSDAIPLYYCKDICELGAPLIRISPFVDILFQEFSSNGYVFRRYRFYVKKPVMLLTKISEQKFCIFHMAKGDLYIQLGDDNYVCLEEGAFSVCMINTDEHSFSFEPGTYELLRFDYSPDILENLYLSKDEYEKAIGHDSCIILEHNLAEPSLAGDIFEILSSSAETGEEMQLFYNRMRTIFKQLLPNRAVLKELDNIS